MTDAELKKLNRAKGACKSSLTNFTNFLVNKKELFEQDKSAKRKIYLQVEIRLNEIIPLINKFRSIQEQVENLSDDSMISDIDVESASYENSYYEQVAIAKEFLEILNSNIEHTAEPSTAAPVHSSISTNYEQLASGVLNNPDYLAHAMNNCQIKLPTIALPKFSGSYTKWREFKDTFEALIHNSNSISDIQKFYYLRASLEGDAATIIASMEVAASNYASAWVSVCERYDNKRLLVQNHLRALFNLQESKKESAAILREILDTVTQHLRALQNLGQPVEQWDSMIIFIIASKFDDVTAREWESQRFNGELPTLEEIKNFIRNKAAMLETLKFERNENKIKFEKGFSNKSKSFVSSEFKCYFCKDGHSVYNCPNLVKLNVEDRISECKALKLCVNCLRPGHIPPACTQRGCKRCNLKHNSLLHLNKQNERESKSAEDKKSLAAVGYKKSLTVYDETQVSSLLPTALANATDFNNHVRIARILLDCGSQCNFIQERYAKALKLKIEKVNLKVSGIGNSETVVQEISGFLPQTKITYQKIPRKCELADPGYAEPGEINVLIGADMFWTILRNQQISLGQNELVLRETALGWVITGRVPTMKVSSAKCYLSKNVDIQVQLQRFWELEECNNETFLSKEETFCEMHYRDTHARSDDGRFVVSIPFLKSVNLLGSSEETARKRFFNLERKLQNSKELKQQYSEFMSEYENLGHMVKVQERSKQEYFLPHHAVVKDTSKTTKLRVVFDASCPSTSGYSLNDIQAVGPTVQNDLLNILIRFRQHAIAITADIAKMYRQVDIRPDECSLQQIFWRREPSQPLDIFQLKTVTYGTAAASFLAIRCLSQLAIENKHKHPIASEIIQNDFYVDDLLTGADTLEEACNLIQNISEILNEGCFPLRKWISNDIRALKSIKTNIELTVLNLGETENTKTLGLYWDPNRDYLLFNIESLNASTIATKRTILSAVGQIFDPLGLIGACTVRAKIMLQLLWQEKVDWDNPINKSIERLWIDFRKDLLQLNQLRIPRCIVAKNVVSLQLHLFGDASEKAYGTCAYLRCVNQNGSISTNLIASKSKVAPLKSQTIPRLELCAALLSAKLLDKIRTALRLEFDGIFLWSDSTIVLAWLKTAPNLLKIFVANRVNQINNLTQDGTWRYIPTAQNPADLLSRGANASMLLENKLWWHGPPCLEENIKSWPAHPCMSEDLPELRPIKNICLSVSIEREFASDYSELLRVKRIVAYIMRFRNIKVTPKWEGGVLTADELEVAERILIRNAQGCAYATDIKDLEKKRILPNNSQLKSLNPFLDENKILRVGGRLQFANLPMAQKHPIILPPRSHFLYLLFKREHMRLGHAGPAQMLYSVREKYWPIHGRNVARRVVHECVRCYKAKPINSVPIMGCLPEERIKPTYPFKNTGVDYAGPFLVKKFKGRGARNIKCYIAVFVCMVTKASHLEIVSALTTEAFLAALKRFVARRGKPSQMHSDNGTNFIGADRELRAIVSSLKENNDKIVNCLAGEGISWKFIPASAPHFGGLWESTVKRTKFHLKRVVGNNKALDFEEFTTLACQIEAILNSRPLCPLSTHPEDLESLTPGHFLIGRSLTALPEEDLTGVPEGRLSHFERVQRMMQDFWARWSREYLPEMQPRSKWQSHNSNLLRLGDMVLVHDSNQPPLCWPLGRITHLFNGPDGLPRVATIRTKGGIVKRPVVKLFLLPLQREDEKKTDCASA